jgi:hypothetical protein
MSTKFDIEVTLVELINIECGLTEYVSPQGREGRGFDLWITENILRVLVLLASATQYHSHSQNIIFWTCDPNNYCITRLENSILQVRALAKHFLAV